MSTRKRPAKPKAPTPVDNLKHKDKRANIPTDELRGFVSEDEGAPKEILYPRDPSLDPQLVWKGKDALDQEPLTVPSVPIYIQEKIHPRVIIENLRRTAAEDEPEPELTLFNDFNGIEFEELVDFYQHQQNWANRLILGDSLLVMTSLAEKEGLKGQVQMIYVDPPYGIKFGSNWQVSTRKRDVKDGKVEDATRQPEQIRAFRDTWELGIHSYLTYLRDRFVVARELLTESGSIFVQIGDENIHLVRNVMDEVFGSENFVNLITFKKTSAVGSFAGGTNVIAGACDYLLWYARSIESVKYRQLYRDKEVGGSGAGAYNWIELADGTRRGARREEREDLGAGRFFRPSPLTSETVREAQTTVFPVELNGRTFVPGRGGWKTNPAGMARLAAAGRLIPTGRSLNYVRFVDDFPAFALTNFWDDTQSGSGMDKVYVVQTNTKIVERCLLMTTDPGDLVLDPTCGSGTTAVVSEEWGRRWITTDTSRVALTLARTRLMAMRHPFYLLADSVQGLEKEVEASGEPAVLEQPTTGDIRQGFVTRRVPHITLKSIAQNPDIREGMTREEIDAAIARHAEQEILVDQPYEDGKRIRVTGPFTVESVSPHRVLAEDEAERASTDGVPASGASFLATIIENLRKAGVQNTVKDEHLDFALLEPFAGAWVNARGEFTDKDVATRAVAISVGPEYGTVDDQQIREAAKEALKGAGVDLLLVCGFAFDPRAGETAREFQPAAADAGWAVVAEERALGKLPVLLVRMNPDLAMGEDLLKKTGAGNLFMVFGEPDVTIAPAGEGKLTVEIHGVDVYDPTTGVLRSNSVDDIACWFIDTSYNEESFFVRHAYFLGADDPYEKLKRALRADIDEAAWETLYQSKSRPFDKPETGKIAVKVINHYGDEVLKVYDVS